MILATCSPGDDAVAVVLFAIACIFGGFTIGLLLAHLLGLDR